MGNDISRSQQGGGYPPNNKHNKKVSRRMSMGSGLPTTTNGRPPAIRVGGSTGFLDVEAIENGNPAESPRMSLSNDQLSARSRSGSQASGSQSPNKQPQPKVRRCSLSMKNRQLIQGCFNNPHENIGSRILKRSAEKRKDFGRFYLVIGAEHREHISDTIKQLLKKSVANIYGADEELQAVATEFGQRFVEFRLLGFKADFFAVLADSTISECVLLDAAVHPAALTLTAFSQFITMLFSAVRDGFYREMRRLRRTSNSFANSNGTTITTLKKLSVEDGSKVIVANGRVIHSASVTPRSSPTPEPRIGGDKSANSSPVGYGSEEETSIIEQPNPRKITQTSTGSRRSVDPLRAKEELRLLTAEFLGHTHLVGRTMVMATTGGGKDNDSS